jgi:branched-chain amino acid transport system ATP-binding protein
MSSVKLEWLGHGRKLVNVDAGDVETLVAAEVHAGYGRAEVLFGVSVTVTAGECVALLGANGAGKTTFLRVLSGIVNARKGKVLLGGKDVTNMVPERIVRLGVAHVPEGRRLFATMSVEENIRIGGYTLPRESAEERVSQVLELFPQMSSRRSQAAGQLSGGEQQMVAMMRGLMSGPRMLLLDEPTLGLSPAARDLVLRAVGEARDAGLGVLMVEQNARKALEVSDRCCVLRSGRIVYEASSKDALGSYDDLAIEYLGTGAA